MPASPPGSSARCSRSAKPQPGRRPQRRRRSPPGEAEGQAQAKPKPAAAAPQARVRRRRRSGRAARRDRAQRPREAARGLGREAPAALARECRPLALPAQLDRHRRRASAGPTAPRRCAPWSPSTSACSSSGESAPRASGCARGTLAEVEARSPLRRVLVRLLREQRGYSLMELLVSMASSAPS